MWGVGSGENMWGVGKTDNICTCCIQQVSCCRQQLTRKSETIKVARMLTPATTYA